MLSNAPVPPFSPRPSMTKAMLFAVPIDVLPSSKPISAKIVEIIHTRPHKFFRCPS